MLNLSNHNNQQKDFGWLLSPTNFRSVKFCIGLLHAAFGIKLHNCLG